MADSNPSIQHPSRRKRQLPSTEVLLHEAHELLRYAPPHGFVWVKHRGRVPHDLIGKVAGGDSGHGYLTMNLLRHRFYVHRLVWLWHYSDWPAGMLDHINGDRKDNRIENLRTVSAVQNVWNRTKRSGELAIGVNEVLGGFNARIQLESGEKAYLGTFATEQEAQAAYIGAATILHGEFAVFKRHSVQKSSQQDRVEPNRTARALPMEARPGVEPG